MIFRGGIDGDHWDMLLRLQRMILPKWTLDGVGVFDPEVAPVSVTLRRGDKTVVGRNEYAVIAWIDAVTKAVELEKWPEQARSEE